MSGHLEGQAALVTGGTAGIGLATGLALGRAGAQVYLTHRWGSHDEDAIRARFLQGGAPEPRIIEADVASAEDTRTTMETIAKDHPGLHILVSNVAFGHVSRGMEDLSQRSLRSTMKYSAWPFVGFVQQAVATFKRPPRYAIGISSTGPRAVLPGYTYLAAAKAAMETYCRYLSASLIQEPINLNIVVANPVETDSLTATFGPEFAPFCRRYGGEGYFITPDEVGSAVLALSSGLMDGVKGAVLELDRGQGFADNVAGLFTRRKDLGL